MYHATIRENILSLILQLGFEPPELHVELRNIRSLTLLILFLNHMNFVIVFACYLKITVEITSDQKAVVYLLILSAIISCKQHLPPAVRIDPARSDRKIWFQCEF